MWNVNCGQFLSAFTLFSFSKNALYLCNSSTVARRIDLIDLNVIAVVSTLNESHP